jgi:hypothetical protein
LKPRPEKPPTEVRPQTPKPSPNPQPAIPEPQPPIPVPQPPGPRAPLTRAAIPGADAIAAADKVVKELYKAEYAKKGLPDMAALARLLINEADQSVGDPAALYLLLREARDLGAAGGEVDAAMIACRRLRNEFALNIVETRDAERNTLFTALRAMAALPPQTTSQASNRRAVDLALMQAERDFASDNYAYAMQGIQLAMPLCRRTADPDLYDRCNFRLITISNVAAEYEKTRESIIALKANPNDPAICLAIGRFYTLLARRPELGLPYLVKGADPLLKTAAEKELLAPTGVAEQLALGDAWAEAAKAQPTAGPVKDALQRLALHWYDQAARQDNGLSKVAAAKRATDLRLMRLQRGGLLGEYFTGTFSSLNFTRIDPRVEYNWKTNDPEGSMNTSHFTVRWTGFMKAGAGQYELIAVHDDAIRVWIDGQLVIDQWKPAHARSKATVNLTGAMQEIKIDYAQYDGEAHVGLGWIPPGAGKKAKAKVIPAEIFFHEALPPAPVVARPPGQKDGRVVLWSKTAHISGAHLKFSANNGKLTEYLGDWNSTSSYPYWDFEVRTEGDYAVRVTYASGGKRAGNQYQVDVSGRKFEGTYMDTGGLDDDGDFKEYEVGVVHLAPGGQQLQFHALNKKPNLSLPPLRKVELVLLK